MAKRRAAYVNLDEPIFDAFAQAAATAYPGQPLTTSLREAALVWLGTDPLEAARLAARRAAWLAAKVEIAILVGGAMKQAAATFAQQVETARSELEEMARTAA